MSESSSNAKNLLVLGNPLLDISAEVPSSLLDKYELQNANAILADEKHLPLYDELIKEYDVQYIAGGAGQNSARVAQWMLQGDGSTTYIGCVGNDDNGATLKKQAEKDGVNPLYLVDEEVPTGTCAVLVVDNDRSLVTQLAAANHYKASHMETEEAQKALTSSDVFYISSFFLTVSPETAEIVAKHAAETNKVFSMNLAAPFLMTVFTDRVLALIPYMDYIFGNESEALAFAESQGWSTEHTVDNLKDIALKLAAWEKTNTQRERIVVITHGSDDVIIAQNGETSLYPILPVAKESIVDLNGAGDAYVGGFLAGLLKGCDMKGCTDAANFSAHIIIQRSGCTFPDECDYTFV